MCCCSILTFRDLLSVLPENQELDFAVQILSNITELPPLSLFDSCQSEGTLRLTCYSYQCNFTGLHVVLCALVIYKSHRALQSYDRTKAAVLMRDNMLQ